MRSRLRGETTPTLICADEPVALILRDRRARRTIALRALGRIVASENGP
jgi:hypothetical protein